MTPQRKKTVLFATVAAISAVFVGSAWALHLGPFEGADRGPVVATVDGEPIYLSDARYRALGLASTHGDLVGSLGEAWYDEVLWSLVDDVIIRDEAARLGLSVPDQEVAAQILELRGLFPSLTEYEAWLASQQIDEDELERRIRLQALAVRVYQAVTADVVVGDEEISAYYEEHTDEFVGGNGDPVPLAEVRASIEESLLQEKRSEAYAAWRDERRDAVSVVIVMNEWWRSIEDEQQS